MTVQMFTGLMTSEMRRTLLAVLPECAVPTTYHPSLALQNHPRGLFRPTMPGPAAWRKVSAYPDEVWCASGILVAEGDVGLSWGQQR